MLNNRQVYAIVGVASAIWLGLALTHAIDEGPAAILDLANFIPLLLLLGIIFEAWLWRWPPLHPHVIGTPVVRGTWRGMITSMWPDPALGGRPRPPKRAYVAVDQTLFTVSVRMLTDESESDQMVGAVSKLPNGKWAISYTYHNTPDLPLRDGSRPHFGGAVITVLGGPPNRLEGEYWNDRNAKGTFAMDARSPAVAQSYVQAEAMSFGPSDAA
jgi:hypothetical protein